MVSACLNCGYGLNVITRVLLQLRAREMRQQFVARMGTVIALSR